MNITELEPRHETALRDFLADFAAAGEDIPGYFAEDGWSHAETVERLAAWSRGEGLPDGWIPCTTFFLEDGEGRLLGVVNLRHRLTPALEIYGGHVGYAVRPSARGRGHATRMLASMKTEGTRRGMGRLLVTCDPANLASARVIVRCGGVYQDEVVHEETGRAVSRYWIALD